MTLATSRALVIAGSLALALPPAAEAQNLLGFDGGGGVAVRFDMIPGYACPTAAPFAAVFPAAGVASPCAAAPVLAAPGGPGATLLGDIAVNRVTDVTYVTDGVVITEFVNGSPVFGPPPGGPVNNYLVPAIPTPAGFMGPLTGMGFDPAGAAAGGIPTLWVTDGAFIAGLGATPPGSCAIPPIVVPSFFHGLPGPPLLTDVTWDPFTGTLWACDAAGVIWNIAVGGGIGPGGFLASGICGTVPPLTGIAYDLASPGVGGFGTNQPAPSVFVTDGFIVEYIDLTTAGPAAPTFYASGGPCIVAPLPLNGLAFSSHAVKWATPPSTTSIESVGQSSAPGPTFGLGMTGGTAGSNVWIFFGLNARVVPSGGFFCPGLPGLGSLVYADAFAPPGNLLFLGAMPAGGVFFVPGAIGPLPPPGVEIFAQFLEDFSLVGAGPFTLTDPLLITITAP